MQKFKKTIKQIGVYSTLMLTACSTQNLRTQTQNSKDPNNNDGFFEFFLASQTLPGVTCTNPDLLVTILQYINGNDQLCIFALYNNSILEYKLYQPSALAFTMVQCSIGLDSGPLGLEWSFPNRTEPIVAPAKGYLGLALSNPLSDCPVGKLFVCSFWNNSTTFESCSGTSI